MSTAPGAVFATKPGVASTGARFVNYLVDYAIFTLAVASFAYGLRLATGYEMGFIGGLLGPVVLYVLFESIWQRTPGKWLSGTKVVRTDGTKPKFPQTVGRSLARLIPFDALSYLALKNGWHDRVSGTYVVSKSMSAEDVAKIDKSRLSGRHGVLTIVVLVLGSIFLLGLLSTMVVVALNNARTVSRDAARLRDIKSIEVALVDYHGRNDAYPEGADAFLGDTAYEALCDFGFAEDCRGSELISAMPAGPAPFPPNCQEAGEFYRYSSESPESFEVAFCLEKGLEGYAAGMHYLTPDGIR